MKEVKVESVQGKRAEPVALLDFGQASKVTKGQPYLIEWEYCMPPFDTMF